MKVQKPFSQHSQLTKNEKFKHGNFSQPNVLSTILPQSLERAQKELWKSLLQQSRYQKLTQTEQIEITLRQLCKNFDPNINMAQINLMHEYAHPNINMAQINLMHEYAHHPQPKN